MMRRVFGGFLAVMLILAAVMPAGAETVLQINGELEPKTQEETLPGTCISGPNPIRCTTG